MYASKSPQKPDEGPSQMTIFDLQGEIDAADFGAVAYAHRTLPTKKLVEV